LSLQFELILLAVQQGQQLESKFPDIKVHDHGVEYSAWAKELDQLKKKYNSGAANIGSHKTSPAIWEGISRTS
jgi:hypothetical protein